MNSERRAARAAARAAAVEPLLRGVTLTLWLPEIVCPSDLVGALNRARKEARKVGNFGLADVLGKLLFLAHPAFHDFGDKFPPRFDEQPMNETQVREIRRRLRGLYSDDEAECWLTSPHPLLGNRAPLHCSYGEVKRRVLQMRNEAYT